MSTPTPGPVAADPASGRTVRALVATVLATTPLAELFTNDRWFLDVFVASAVVALPAAVIRRWYPPRVWHAWAGLALLVPWLTLRFLSDSAIGSVLPGPATVRAANALLSTVRETSAKGIAPVLPTPGITFVLAAIAGLLMAFVDLVAVVGRRPAVAGLPFLVIFAACGAVRRHPVSWVLFLGPAVAFLLLLSIEARSIVRQWGRVIPRAGETRPSTALGVSVFRIGITALVVALLAPLVIARHGSNILADAVHESGSGGDGSHLGAGSGTSLDPFAALAGDLQRAKPVKLFTVHVDPARTAPYYLRANVLSGYTPAGWQVGTPGPSVGMGVPYVDTDPEVDTADGVRFTATVSIAGLRDNPPVFTRLEQVGNIATSTRWSASDELLTGSTVSSGQVITEVVSQPSPTVADLNEASADYPPVVRPDLLTPALPALVTNLVATTTRSATTPYQKARAINDFFTGPASGFSYSLQTKPADSGDALSAFLTNRTGFCQQYAAAMAIMLRVAGVPARVVLGYTHPAPDGQGNFTVTSSDAHAWVEAFFPSLGWIPFDPTPITGQPGAATANLAWAPHPVSGGANPADPAPSRRSSAAPRPTVSAPSTGPVAVTGRSRPAARVPWALVWTLLGLAVLGALALFPAALRNRRRRRRLRLARRGDPDPLWAELVDTAIDLGYVWSPARTPRQVAGWLGRDTEESGRESLHRLAAAVEQARYARDGQLPAEAGIKELGDIRTQLRARRSRSTRIRSRLLPASLGWHRRTGR